MKSTFQWVGGATWIFTIDGLKISCDPVLCPRGTVQNYRFFKSKRLDEPVYDKNDFKDTDIWLITHGHEDHLDDAGVEMIIGETPVICPKAGIPRLSKKHHRQLVHLDWNEKKEFPIRDWKVTVQAVPAVHGELAITAFLCGKGNGYFISIEKDQEKFQIYATGDTVLNQAVSAALKDKTCDLFVPNVGEARVGNGSLGKIFKQLTLNMNDMEELRKNLHPGLTIPVHFGTFSHYSENKTSVYRTTKKGITVLKPGMLYRISD